MMDDKDKCRICKQWWMTKTNVETLKTKHFYLSTRKNVTKKHDESLSFDYVIYIYKVFSWKNKNYISKKYFDVLSCTVLLTD